LDIWSFLHVDILRVDRHYPILILLSDFGGRLLTGTSIQITIEKGVDFLVGERCHWGLRLIVQKIFRMGRHIELEK
jgi:hypothetical protein